MMLFVYGTLRRDAPMHGLLAGRVSWIGPASAAGRLVDLGSFPGLVPALTAGDRVQGELYAIASEHCDSLLDALDRYEGASFTRVRERVWGPDGAVEAWLYLYRGDASGRPVFESGDYLVPS